MQDLTGKVVWAIGAGTGIGASGAELLAGAGARVVLSGRRREPLDDMVARIQPAGGEAYAEALDIADGPFWQDRYYAQQRRHQRAQP